MSVLTPEFVNQDIDALHNAVKNRYRAFLAAHS
jgi:hypothetical protein